MKKALFISLTLLFCLLFAVSCGKGKESDVRYDYNLNRYVKLGQCEVVKANFEEPKPATEEEIDAAQHQVLLSYAEFAAKEETGTVEMFDLVELEYYIFYKNNEVEEFTEKNYRIIVGSEGFGEADRAMGLALEGLTIGESAEVPYTFPEDYEKLGDWAGESVLLKGTVKGISEPIYPEFNDDFVISISGEDYDFTTVEEFRESLAESIYERKQGAKAAAVFEAFLASVEVKRYPKKEMEQYLGDIYGEAVSNASSLGISVEEYVSSYEGVTIEQFEINAEREAEKKVKDDMACIQAIRTLGTTLSEEEYKVGVERMFEEAGGVEESGFESLEAYVAFYKESELRVSLLWEKTFRTMLENAVPAE